MKKKIVIDARMYGLEHTGIGRYVMSLIKEIKKIEAGEFKFILLVPQKKLEQMKKELGKKFAYFPVKSKHYSFREQLEIPLVLGKIKPDLVHFPHFNSSLFWFGPFVVTIHDLTKHYFRGRETTTRSPLLYWIKYLSYRFLVYSSLKRSKLIIVPTFYWKQKLVEGFNIPESKIIVTYEAVGSDFTKKAKKEAKTLSEKQPFFVYTGNVYPHKNIERFLRALRKIPKVKLNIVCSRSVFTERVEKLISKLKLEKRVTFLGFVPDQDLVPLYQKAIALVQPSLMEGFGLTGLEAMTAGCPVLSSNASCLPEIYGDAAVYFDPLDVNDITDKLKLILKDKELRKDLISKGKKQAEKFSWRKTAEETIKGYRKIL